MITPNAFAYVMLAIWPVVAYVLWTRLDPARALIWTILAGYLLLPPLTAFDLPVVPDFDKTSIPNLSALVLAFLILGDKISFLPDGPVGRLLIGLFIVPPFATVLANSDPIPITSGDIQGMTLYDSVASVTNQIITLLPFFLARRYLATPQAMRTLIVALLAAGFAYSVPMVLETQISPQLNIWFYGFFQHDFSQAIRSGGYRPFVFLQHGLWVAFFALMCLMSAVILFRAGPATLRPYSAVAVLFMVLLLLACKSLGPILYAVLLIPVLLLAPRRWQLVVAASLALVVVIYPLLRGAHLIPLDSILEIAGRLNPERAESLAYRFDNEERLLARALERPVFGWGGYARNQILDPITGDILSVPDGDWIIVLGIYGWLGYIAEFGLLALPLMMLGRLALDRRASVVPVEVAGVALILAANMVDLLPNATVVSLTWLMAGALLGYAEALGREMRPQAVSRSAVPRRTVI